MGQSAVLRFVGRYMVVSSDSWPEVSKHNNIFVVFWRYNITRYQQMTFHFLRQYFTRGNVKLVQSKLYTTCAMRLKN